MSLTCLLSPKTLTPRAIITNLSTRFLATFSDTPSCQYYDDLTNDAGRSRDFESLRQILNKRCRERFFNTARTFNFITKTESSISLIDDLIKNFAKLNKGFTRKNAFDTLIARLCKLEFIDEAMRVVEEMERGGHGLNAVSFQPIFVFLTRRKRIDDTWRLMERMIELKISPDLTAYNCLLTAHCTAGDLTAASDVLTKMIEAGIEADARTYDALVMGACRSGRVEGAFVLLRRMEDEGIHVLTSIHAHFISGLLSLGYYAQAVKYVMVYSGRDWHFDTENFGLLASRLIKLNRHDEAKTVLMEMEDRGLKMGPKLKDFYEQLCKNVNAA